MVKTTKKVPTAQGNNPDTLTLENPRNLARQTVAQLQAEWAAVLRPPSPSSTPEPPPTYKNYSKLNFIDICRYGDGDVAKLKKLIILRKCLFQKTDLHAHVELPLRLAAENGHTEVIKFLMDNGADIYANDNAALRWAARNGHMAAVRLLYDYDADIHAHHDFALRYAAHNGHTEIVQYLLAQGAHIHAESDEALRWAAEYGHTETVQLLLKHDANIHAEDNSALKRSANNGHFDIVDLLVKQGASLKTLEKAQRHEYIAYKTMQADKIAEFKTAAHQTLSEVFKAATWVGQVPEMTQLWSEVPEDLKMDIDFQHALSDANIQTLKQRKPKIKLIR